MENFDKLYKIQKESLNHPITNVNIPSPIREKICEVFLDTVRSNKDIEKIKKRLEEVFGSESGPKELDVTLGLMAAYKMWGK